MGATGENIKTEKASERQPKVESERQLKVESERPGMDTFQDFLYNYSRDTYLLITRFNPDAGWQNLNQLFIKNWRDWLLHTARKKDGSHYSANTFNQHYKLLRGCVNLAVNSGIEEAKQAEAIRGLRFKKEEKTQVVLSSEELQRLATLIFSTRTTHGSTRTSGTFTIARTSGTITDTRTSGERPTGAAERLERVGERLTDREETVCKMFLLGAYTGARFSDFKNLNILEGNIFYTSQKTGKQIVVPLHPVVNEILKNGVPSLGVSESSERVIFDRMIKQVCKKAGINEKIFISGKRGGVVKSNITEKWQLVSSHTARRSFATNLVKSGVNIRAVQLLLGHSSVQTTEKYVKVGLNDFNKELRGAICGSFTEPSGAPERPLPAPERPTGAAERLERVGEQKQKVI